MPILESDIVLLKHQVMADVPEGGGAATGEIIVDNVSNNIFADIPELARIIGEVSLRGVSLAVQTDDTDTYRGARVIISKPPGDPRVSAVVFKSSEFDRRTDMQSDIESFLARGPKWPAYLYDNHIEGQRAIMLLQRVGTELPAVGKTLVLVGNEGLGTEYEQFVRVTKVSSQTREFTVSDGSTPRTFTRAVVTCEISDALRYDFFGVPATDLDAGSAFTGKAVVRDTNVADATHYFGASPLVQAAQTGDLSVRVASISTSLVPSAQTETSITDARPNQRILVLQEASADTITITSSATFGPGSALYIGGSIYPGSVSIAVAGGPTLTDANSTLKDGTTTIATIDYANGVITPAATSPTYAGTKSITYKPAGAPTMPTETVGIPVTVESRSATLALTLNPIPAPGSLTVSYMAGGKWYTLTDGGTGAIRGAETVYGAGNLSFVTGTLNASLGAQPDVGSEILLTWGSPGFCEAAPATTARAFFSGSLGQAVAPGSVTLSWDSLSVTDDGKGSLTGAGTGTIDYATGDFELQPDAIPAQGTTWNAAFSDTAAEVVGGTLAAFTDLGLTWEGALGAGFLPGSFSAEVQMQVHSQVAGVPSTSGRRRIVDDAAGKLLLVTQSPTGAVIWNEIGTINASTGLMSITKNVTLATQINEAFDYINTTLGAGVPWQIPVLTRWETSASATIEQGSPALTNVRSTAGAGAGTSATGEFVALRLRIPKPPAANLVSSSISLAAGTHRFQDRLGRLVRDIDPATNAGTDVGPVDYTSGMVTLTTWPGLTTQPFAVKGTLLQYGDVLVTGATFRTPVAPLRPASLNIAATRKSDGTVVTATADANGYIATADMVGLVNAQTGVARVWFRQASGAPEAELDVSAFGIPGVTTVHTTPVFADTLRFNAVAYTYLPLPADIVGLDPVRLPTDGKVPIFRSGDVTVVHHTASTTPTAVINGQTIDCGRTRLARARVIGNNGAVITAGYTANLDAGTVNFTNVSGYSQPVHVEHMVKDEVPAAEAQIGGTIVLNRPLSHDYPLGSMASSALLVGNLFARVPLMFDQQSWTGVWSDDLIGSPLSANYNSIAHPLVLTNRATITERWAIRFKNTTTFELIGENVGFIAEGNVTEDFSPINPAVSLPFFTIRAAGWGGGWPQGGVLRINTVGALYPLGLARTVQQGDAALDDDSFTLMILGDRDRT